MATNRRRLELQEKLCTILGSNNVYYQPPANIQMRYPCIVYSPRADMSVRADNKRYVVFYPYSVQIIAHDPEFELFDTFVDNFEYASKSAPPFAKDNLNHNNYIIYF